ncbi:polysaccharide deacetylase family protein [Pelosinus sp. sgz500959]|uniref:polysaccharide deacetylase family protein n=1 Tax=Pelosinus sp. sgz500959 TaxID=3242472 RepID=UPI003671F6F9
MKKHLGVRVGILLLLSLILLILCACAKTPETLIEPANESSKTNLQRELQQNQKPVKSISPGTAEAGHVKSNKIKIALTFDDGPVENTNRLLDCFEKYNVKTTFFVLGSKAEKNPDTIKRMDALGMEVANHTYNHTSLNFYNYQEFMSEAKRAGDLLEKLTGKRTTILRFPGGALNYRQDVIARIPYSIINWTINTEDWKASSKQVIIDRIRNSKDGAILFLHDSPVLTAEALEECLPQLLEEGYEFLTISELAKANGIMLLPGTIYDRLESN